MEPVRHKLARQSPRAPRRTPQDSSAELTHLVDLFAPDSYARRKLGWFAIALVMEDSERAWFVGAQELGGERWLTFRTITGDEFPLPDPGLPREVRTKFIAAVQKFCRDNSAARL